MNDQNQVTPIVDKKRSWTDRNSPSDSNSCAKSSRIMADISDLTDKMDTLLRRTENMERSLEANTETLNRLSSDYVSVEQELGIYKEDNRQLRDIIACLDSRLQRTENAIEGLKSVTIDLSFRSMKHNMIICGVKENKDENIIAVTTDFLFKEMKISRKRLSTDIVCDIVHRLGRGNDRPIIVRFTTHRGKAEAMRFCPNLKGTQFYVKDQLPYEMAQKASALVPKLKKLKEKADDPKTVKLVRDMLISNGEIVNPEFSLNKIQVDVKNLSPEINLHDITHSDSLTVNETCVQAHSYPATTIDEVKTVLAKIRTAPSVLKANHLMYAYLVRDPQSGNISKGYDDDHEFGMSKILLRILEQCNYNGVLVVSKRNGPQRMKDRNKVIAKLVQDFIGGYEPMDNED